MMEFPKCLEEHLYQVAKHLINKTTAVFQESLRHHWKAIPGNNFWDVETGSELWLSCHTQLQPTSKKMIVKGRINNWSIADLAVLLPEVILKSGNSSLAQQYSDALKNILDLFTPLGSYVALSREEFQRFKSSLTGLLTQLDTGIMTLSSITENLIPVKDLAKVVASLTNISRLQKTSAQKTTVISRVTELLESFPNLPPYFEEALYKFRLDVRAETPCVGMTLLTECLKVISFDRCDEEAHAHLSMYFYDNTGKNHSLHFYHDRSGHSLLPYRAYFFNFVKDFIDQHPNDPACFELQVGFGLIQISKTHSFNHYLLANNHFKLALQHGSSLGLYAHGITTLLMRDVLQNLHLNWKFERELELDKKTYQNAVKMLIKEVKKEPLFHKYYSSKTEFDKRGHAHFLLGYQYEKGYLPWDHDKAKEYYRTAATVYNNGMASYNLGSMYYDGAGVIKSYILARFYWLQANPESNTEWPAFALLDHFLKHFEFAFVDIQVTHMGKLSPSILQNEQLKWVMERVKKFKSHRLYGKLWELKRQLVAEEEKWKLSAKGLTLLERLKRVELLGFKHEFGTVIKKTYDFFKLSYGTERNGEGDGGTMSAYVHGVDDCLEVDYSQLFSRLYLVAPARIFTVTTFRQNLATSQQSKWNIKYQTKCHAELLTKFPQIFKHSAPERFTVIEDVLIVKDAICLIIEDMTNGIVHHLKLPRTKAVIRIDDKLKLEYGAKIALSFMRVNGHSGNADAYFKYMFDDSMVEVEVIVMGKVAKMCRFCCEPIVNVKECVCGFSYCGQICLEKDRKYLKHEVLCSVST